MKKSRLVAAAVLSGVLTVGATSAPAEAGSYVKVKQFTKSSNCNLWLIGAKAALKKRGATIKSANCRFVEGQGNGSYDSWTGVISYRI